MKLTVIPRATDINPDLLIIIEDLLRLGREGRYAGLILCAVFEHDAPHVAGDLSKISYHQALGLCADISDQVKAMYEVSDEDTDEDSGP